MSLTKNMVELSALLLLCLCAGMVYGQAEEAAVVAALAQADEDVATVFETLLEAEEVGANVSALRQTLNTTCSSLAAAHAHYSSGNFSGALLFAELTIERVAPLEAEARELADSAVTEQGRCVSSMVMVSVVGALLVPIVGLLAWRYVKAWFVRRIYKMKPEVRDVDEPE